MNITRLLLIAPLPLLLLLVLSCQSDGARQELLAVESYLNSDPERALAVLDSMDRQELTTREDRAHYALLKSMALDKNYIDLTSDSVIAPAVAYYSKHGTADQKMKAYFYQGVVYQNAQQDDLAVASYLHATSFMDQSQDHRMKGVIYMALQNIYDNHYCINEEKKYLDLGLQEFMLAKDTVQYAIALIQLAKHYQGNNEWEKADSLYRALSSEVTDKNLAEDYMVNYAVYCLNKPDIDAYKAIDLYDSLIIKYKYRIDADDAGRLAYAHYHVGNHDISKQLLSLFDPKQLDYWIYRIAMEENNLQQAITYLHETSRAQNSMFKKVLSESTLQSVAEYYAYQRDIQKERTSKQRTLYLLLLLLIVAACLLIYRIIISSKRKQQERYENVLSAIRYTNGCLEATHNSLQRKFIALYQDKFAFINDLYKVHLLQNKNQRLHQDLLVQKVTQILSFVKDDLQLEKIINNDLDNLIEELKTEISLSKEDVLLICFFIIKLDSKIISSITNMSTSNIYTRKSRIIKKIQTLDSPNKEKYMQYLR